MKIIVNGLPGKVAQVSANHIANQSDMQLHHHSMSGPRRELSSTLVGTHNILLIPSRLRESHLDTLLDADIAVDYTHPDTIHSNVDFYCENKLPFIMGTTGGDRDALDERVRNSDTVAIIAPNMAPQIVAFQAFVEEYATALEGELSGYNLTITESHQKGKADTSGTAKAMIRYFNKLGIAFEKSQIDKIRTIPEQLALGVAKEHLAGHGWHTYRLTLDGCVNSGILYEENQRDIVLPFNSFLSRNSAFDGFDITYTPESTGFEMGLARTSQDNSVLFMQRPIYESNGETVGIELTHNVNGRQIYADGTVLAARFLKEKMDAGVRGKVYSMIDVLKGV